MSASTRATKHAFSAHRARRGFPFAGAKTCSRRVKLVGAKGRQDRSKGRAAHPLGKASTGRMKRKDGRERGSSAQNLLADVDARLARLEEAMRAKLIAVGRLELLQPLRAPPTVELSAAHDFELEEVQGGAADDFHGRAVPAPAVALALIDPSASLHHLQRTTYFASMSLFPELAAQLPLPLQPRASDPLPLSPSSPSFDAYDSGDSSLANSPRWSTYTSPTASGASTPPTPASPRSPHSPALEAWGAPCETMARLRLDEGGEAVKGVRREWQSRAVEL